MLMLCRHGDTCRMSTSPVVTHASNMEVLSRIDFVPLFACCALHVSGIYRFHTPSLDALKFTTPKNDRGCFGDPGDPEVGLVGDVAVGERGLSPILTPSEYSSRHSRVLASAEASSPRCA